MHFCCQRQLIPMLRPVESYSGTCAWAAIAAEAIAERSAASVHLIDAVDGTRVRERQALLIRRTNTADQERLCGALVLEGWIIAGELVPENRMPRHDELLRDHDSLVGLAWLVERDGLAVEDAPGWPNWHQPGSRAFIAKQQASAFVQEGATVDGGDDFRIGRGCKLQRP